MIGVVLAAHGKVAFSLLEAAQGIVGPIPNVKALSLQSGDSPEVMRKALGVAVKETTDGSGVLILCDVFGGTPANVCMSTECGTQVEVVTGVNLPMLVKLSTMRQSASSVRELASQIALYGQRHITHATELLRQRKKPPEMTAPMPRIAANDSPAEAVAGVAAGSFRH